MYDRTEKFYKDFLSAFTDANLVVLTDTYDARPDGDSADVDMQKFADDLNAEAISAGSLDAAKDLLRSSILQSNDVLIVMGAGDVTRIASELSTFNSTL